MITAFSCFSHLRYKRSGNGGITYCARKQKARTLKRIPRVDFCRLTIFDKYLFGVVVAESQQSRNEALMTAEKKFEDTIGSKISNSA